MFSQRILIRIIIRIAGDPPTRIATSSFSFGNRSTFHRQNACGCTAASPSADPRDAPLSRNTSFGPLKRSKSHPRSGNTHIGDEHVRISRAGATFLQLDSQICSWIRGSDAVHLNMQPLAQDIPTQALSQQGPAGCAQRISIRHLRWACVYFLSGSYISVAGLAHLSLDSSTWRRASEHALAGAGNPNAIAQLTRPTVLRAANFDTPIVV